MCRGKFFVEWYKFNNKIMFLKHKNCIILSILISFFVSACSEEKKVMSSKTVCSQKLPFFQEKFSGLENESKLKILCECIWNSFPRNGWERKVSEKLYKGEEIGWKIKSFSTVFETNLKICKNDIE